MKWHGYLCENILKLLSRYLPLNDPNNLQMVKDFENKI